MRAIANEHTVRVGQQTSEQQARCGTGRGPSRELRTSPALVETSTGMCSLSLTQLLVPRTFGPERAPRPEAAGSPPPASGLDPVASAVARKCRRVSKKI
jgi:hypothetical protein